MVVNQLQTPLLSRRYEMYRRLQSKLLVEDEQAQAFPPAVSRLVSPVLDVTPLLLNTRAAFVNRDLSAGAGAYIAYHTVPAGERWILTWLTRENTIANTHVELRYAEENINFQIVADATATQFFTLSIFTLEENDSIGMLTTGDVGDTNIFLSLLYNEELL